MTLPLETGRDVQWLDAGLSHWRLGRDGDGVAWLVLAQRGAPVNTLSAQVLDELAGLIGEARRLRPAAVVVRSGKQNAFVVGADLQAYRTLDQEQAQAAVRRAQQVLDAVAELAMPTIALLHGACLGGGLQLALACDYRIARLDARLGLPEVHFGVHPALGASTRLPALIGADEALALMLTGRSVAAAEALALGLVDVVGEEHDFAAAVRAAAAGDLELQRPGARARPLTLRPTRRRIANQARREALRRSRPEHAPAPYRLLDLWERHGASPRAMMEHEAASFAELVTGAEARNLLRLFLAGQALEDRSRTPGRRSATAPIRHVHVVGAAHAAGALAGWCASQGLQVSLEDRDAGTLARAAARAADVCCALLGSEASRRAAADRLVPDLRGTGRRKADLLIEAAAERLELKRQICVDLEAAAGPGALIVTQTSAFALADIASALQRPERLGGLHLPGPVDRTRLVEVAVYDGQDSEVRDRLLEFAAAIGRLPLEVRATPGLLVDRVRMPYLREALALLEEGVPAEQIDAAAEQFGMTLGPLALADRLGLDKLLHIMDSLYQDGDGSAPAVPDWLRRQVGSGDIGVASGKGFYRYDAEATMAGQATAAARVEAEHVERLVLAMVNAAVAYLATVQPPGAGPLTPADAVDAALVYGGGFPGFRGGPVQYARQRGSEEVRLRLETLAREHGPRFAPHPGWAVVFGGPPDDAGRAPRPSRRRRR